MTSDTLGVASDIYRASTNEKPNLPPDDASSEQTNGHTTTHGDPDGDSTEDSDGSDVDDDSVDERTRSGTEGEAEEEDEDEDDEDEDEEPTLKYERMPGPINDLLKKDSISALTVSNKLVVGCLHVQLQQSLMHLSGLWYARRHRARTRFDRQTHQIIQASPGVRERHRNGQHRGLRRDRFHRWYVAHAHDPSNILSMLTRTGGRTVPFYPGILHVRHETSHPNRCPRTEFRKEEYSRPGLRGIGRVACSPREGLARP